MSDQDHYYLDDFVVDRAPPADPTLSGWAAEIAAAGAVDGATFAGGRIAWAADIIAVRGEAGWALSREPAADAFAIAQIPDGCPLPDGNILPERFSDPATPGDVTVGTMHAGILQWLTDREEDLGDQVAIAIGEREPGLTFTFTAEPPTLAVAV